MATPTWIPAEDRYRQPRPKAAHPTETFYGDGSTNAGGERIDYGYLLEAHTSGDIYVFFRDSNVLAVGDVASPVQDPSLDYFTGAWIGGRFDALDRLVELAKDDTRIVPGFGPAMTRAELKAERDMMKTIYDRVGRSRARRRQRRRHAGSGRPEGADPDVQGPQGVHLCRPQGSVGASQQAECKCGVDDSRLAAFVLLLAQAVAAQAQPAAGPTRGPRSPIAYRPGTARPRWR